MRCQVGAFTVMVGRPCRRFSTELLHPHLMRVAFFPWWASQISSVATATRPVAAKKERGAGGRVCPACGGLLKQCTLKGPSNEFTEQTWKWTTPCFCRGTPVANELGPFYFLSLSKRHPLPRSSNWISLENNIFWG